MEITPEATNRVKKKSPTPCTRLKAIGEHPADILKIDDLRMFCVRNQIRGARKASKVQLCRAVAAARVKFDDGEPFPYDDLFLDNEKNQHSFPVDVDMMDDANTSDRKRNRDDFEEVDMNMGRDHSIRLNVTDRVHQAKLVTLQSRIAQSIEVKNMAIYLKETIESASAIRREIREERSQRDALWAKLVEQAGDEEAISKYLTYQEARENNVDVAFNQLLEDIFEEDCLIKQLKQQHAKVIDAVSKLV